VVVVARNEARNRCHRSGLLEQEKDIGVRAAIKRIEVWELPVRMRPSQLRDKIRKRHHMWLVKHLLAKRNSFGRTKRTSAICHFELVHSCSISPFTATAPGLGRAR